MAGFRGFVVRSATRTDGNEGPSDARRSRSHGKSHGKADGNSHGSSHGRSHGRSMNATLAPTHADRCGPESPLDASGMPKALVDRIRREWFARAAGVATRYGVLLDEALAHLDHANLAETPGPARALSFLEDLVCAVACVRGHPGAWQDLWERHESILLRASRLRLGDVDAVLATRRFWRELHAVTTLPASDREGLPDRDELPPSLAEYVGVRPLRVWLSDRLLEQVDRQVLAARFERPLRRAGGRTAGRFGDRFDAADSTGPVRMRLVD